MNGRMGKDAVSTLLSYIADLYRITYAAFQCSDSGFHAVTLDGIELLRRIARFPLILAVLTSTLVLAGCVPAAAADAAFQQWLQDLWPAAQSMGISRATFDAATRGLDPDLSLPDLVVPGRPEAPPRGQAEFVQTPADYVKEGTIARLAAQGRDLMVKHRATLEAIERQFGVPPAIILAIWGRETAFGGHKLPHNAIRVLATQAYAGRRKDQFREEFLLALKMLEERHVKLADMRSSWAGAMGLTQFLPSEFYKHGVDFDADGRIDIFNSVPDALASAAKQLVNKGWQPGKRWAYEARPPQAIDCTIAEPSVTLPIGDWLKRGFVPAYGRKLTRDELAETASLLMPEGTFGPAFLTPKNYYVIKDYNFSDLYVLFVGHLSDRILDPRPFETPWSKTAQLRTADVEAMQRRLTELGHYRDKIDGKAGMLTRAALGAYQKANALKVDCWPTSAVLDHMRSRPGAR
jgi:lytic murein transglycosylase